MTTKKKFLDNEAGIKKEKFLIKSTTKHKKKGKKYQIDITFLEENSNEMI